MSQFKHLILLLIIPLMAKADPHNNINDLAYAFMKENKVVGMSIAVIHKNKTHIFNYGYANEFKKTPITSDTLYTIASFTKTFTAALTAVAKVENKLDLDHPFTEYFPASFTNANLTHITSNMLLGHVASLPFDFNPRPKTFSEIVQAYQHFLPPKPAGSEYGYSNAGIGTMGYILQHVYKNNYQEILHNKILQPLGMHSTYLIVPEENQALITLAHDKDNHIIPYSSALEAWFAAASLKSSIADMGKYMNAQINYSAIKNKNLSKAVELVHQNKYCFSDHLSCEQLAWQAHDIAALHHSTGDTYFKDYDNDGAPIFDKKTIVKGNTLSNHQLLIDKTGSGYGMSSYMAYLPDHKTGVVILINKSIGDERIRLGRDILLAYEHASF